MGMGMGMSGGSGSGIGPSGLPANSSTRVTLSAFETANFFVHRNHCEASGASTAYPESGRSPGTHVTRFVPHNCADGKDVAIYVITGGGHTWPGTAGVLDGLGVVNLDINAGDEIWNFFAAHPLPHDPQ